MVRGTGTPMNGITEKRVICFGDIIADYVNCGDSVYRRYPGGSAANVAVGLRHHGISVQLWGKIGADADGEFLVNHLVQNDIPCEALLRSAKHPTQRVYIDYNHAGQPQFHSAGSPHAGEFFSKDDFNIELLQAVAIFHFSAMPLLSEATYQTTAFMVKKARESGCRISFDPNIRIGKGPGAEIVLQRLRKLLPAVDLLKMNRDQAERILEGNPTNFFQRQPETLLIITDGAAGTTIYSEQNTIEIAACSDNSIDPLGAGDAFSAAFLAGLLQKNLLEKFPRLSGNELNFLGNRAGIWARRITEHYGATSAYRHFKN